MHMESIVIQYVWKKKINVTIYKNNTKMLKFDYITKEDIKKYNPIWIEIPDHLYKILFWEVLDLEKQIHCLF